MVDSSSGPAPILRRSLARGEPSGEARRWVGARRGGRRQLSLDSPPVTVSTAEETADPTDEAALLAAAATALAAFLAARTARRSALAAWAAAGEAAAVGNRSLRR